MKIISVVSSTVIEVIYRCSFTKSSLLVSFLWMVFKTSILIFFICMGVEECEIKEKYYRGYKCRGTTSSWHPHDLARVHIGKSLDHGTTAYLCLGTPCDSELWEDRRPLRSCYKAISYLPLNHPWESVLRVSLYLLVVMRDGAFVSPIQQNRAAEYKAA